MKIKKLLLITALFSIFMMQINAQKIIGPSGELIEIKAQQSPDAGALKIDCQNNNGIAITTTGTTTSPYLNPTGTPICVIPPATFQGSNGLWTSFSNTGFITYTFTPAISCATISYSVVNGPNGTGTDVGRVDVNGGGIITLSNPCGANLVGNVLTGNSAGSSNPYGDVNLTVSSTVPFTTITLTNIGGESGWVQGQPCRFILNNCCTDPVADAVLVDAEGKEKDTFCYLEDILLDASASSDYDFYSITVREFDDLGNIINTAQLSPTWQSGTIPSPFNISDYNNWSPSSDFMFCPGGTYSVNLALRNQCGSDDITLRFKVECCRSSAVDAEFELIIPASNGDTYTMEAVNYELYPDSPEDCPITHVWCVYEKDDNGDGSLTYITSIFGEDFTYTGQDGIHYTVVHKVKSPCGDDCYAVEIFRDAEGLRNGAEYSSQRVDCPEDCDPDCAPPTGLTCDIFNGQITLSWDPVSNATGYVVEITFNDPDCCIFGGFPSSLQLETGTNSLPLNFSPAGCWSWRVLSICGDVKSDWSEKKCGKCNERRCEPPTDLTCEIRDGQIILNWNPVIGATGYVVEITFNDPDCCIEAGWPLSTQIETGTNSLPLNFSPAGCWSWRVQSICEDEKSDWSEKKCGKCLERRCETPDRLYCVSVEGGIQLNWSDVSGAVSYIVELVFDDPDCCEGREPTAFRYYPEDNRVWIPTPSQRCWSWKVMAVCGEGNNSEWSEKICMREGFKCLSIFEERNMAGNGQISDEVSLKAFPNPFNDVVNFELNELKTTQYLSLTDVLGRVVLVQEIAPYTSKIEVNTGALTTGIYYARLRQSNGQILTTKIVKR